MALSINLRKMLHRKSVEFCTPSVVNPSNGAHLVDTSVGGRLPYRRAVAAFNASSLYSYSCDEDSWAALPNSGAAGTFNNGACGEVSPLAIIGGISTFTASSGTTTTISTSLALVCSVVGCEVRVVAGAGAGYVGKVTSNTLLSSSVLTVAPSSTVSFDNTTMFQLMSGSFWMFVPGTGTVGFSVYDFATNAWTARSVTGLPTAWSSEGQLVGTPGRVLGGGVVYSSGTALGGTSTTITLGAEKTVGVSQWANYSIRITVGTGAGQSRRVVSHTSGASPVLTVAAWTIAPDATSQYVVEGDNDALYLLGNNNVAVYKYSISGNSWSTVTPGAARASAPTSGMTADWVGYVPDASWNPSETAPQVHGGSLVRQAGRYIYSMRGGSASMLDVFDLCTLSWYSNAPYGGQAETFSTGSNSVYSKGKIYLHKDTSSRLFTLDVATNKLEPWTSFPVVPTSAYAGDRMFVSTYSEGGQEVDYLYMMLSSRTDFVRWLIV